MIVFLTSPNHTYTHAALLQVSQRIRTQILTYSTALCVERLPLATYVFTDCDRLPAEWLAASAALYRCLRDGGARVLNDPARIPSRYGLLRLLHGQGLNRFNAYRMEERVPPVRWPVFLRTDGDHKAPVSGLLHSWDEVLVAAEEAIRAGTPLPTLLVVEYAAEPVRPGLFRKLSAYRVGERCFAHSCVHDDNWLVKYGKLGIATPELYEDELRIVRDNPHGALLESVFAAANVDYGRVDYGLVGGEPQIYEINTNPSIAFPKEHPSAVRLQTYAVTAENYLAALAAIDTDGEGAVPIVSPVLEPYQQGAARQRAQRVAQVPR